MQIIVRPTQPRQQWILEQAGIHPLLAQLYASRGIEQVEEIFPDMQYLLPPDTLKGIKQATQLLANALHQREKLCFVADYDCDGATACAVGIRGLKMLGFQASQIDYIVPDRMIDGYGLTPSLADRVKVTGADLLITVDNGIASLAGVEHARELGLKVLITDHHLPALTDNNVVVPNADAVVNPNQPGCTFPSKSLPGVGVIFYILIALRSHLRTQGIFDARSQPRLDCLLDLVALGTVADVVKLDANNRRLVEQGLIRMRKGQMQPGVTALFEVSLRDTKTANTFDLGFALGPRLNAAGRLADMRLGIECLLTDDLQHAKRLAAELDQFNRERKNIENDMLEQSISLLEQHLDWDEEIRDMTKLPASFTIFDPGFHEGVIGILASRIKEKFHRPVFVFAPASGEKQTGLIKGSGRSIDGLHLRDALDLVEKQYPGMLLRFGGHAMAAGCTLHQKDLPRFNAAFNQVTASLIDEQILCRKLETDGPLPPEFCTPESAALLKNAVWGNGFPPPVFSEKFKVLSQRIVGEKHLSLKLAYHDRIINGIWFRRTALLPDTATLAYLLDINEWNGSTSIQYLIQDMQTDIAQ